MKPKDTRIGPLQSRVLAYTQLRKKQTISSGEIVEQLRLTSQQERNLLRGMHRSGLIVRLRPGLYLVPERIPPAGKYSPGEYLVLSKLMEDAGAKYQICGPTAFEFHGFESQVPHMVFVYNNRLSGPREIGVIRFVFIRTSADRLGSIAPFETPERITVPMPSRERTMLDGVYDWSRFNSLPRAYGWIASSVRSKECNTDALLEATRRFGNQGTIRRIGYLMESLKLPQTQVSRLNRLVSSPKYWIPWIPTQPARGKINRDWGVIVNGTIS